MFTFSIVLKFNKERERNQIRLGSSRIIPTGIDKTRRGGIFGYAWGKSDGVSTCQEITVTTQSRERMMH